MPSSTFSSESSSISVLALLFLSGFLTFGLAAEWLPANLRIELYTWQRHTSLDDSWFLPRFDGRHDFYRGNHLEHARTADVLILGNSRTLFAFRQEFLRPFSERTGIRFFNLGFGYQEGWEFAHEIIRRHDLKPRIVLVNADNFFGSGMSHFARQVISENTTLPTHGWLDRWQLATGRFEEEISRQIQIRVQGFVPRWTISARGDEWRVHRSKIDGSWWMKGFDEISARRPVGPGRPQRAELGPAEFAAIEEFRSEMANRGTAVVITRVPSNETVARTRSLEVARRLGAEFIAPEPLDLETFDRSHLTRASSRRFMADFLREFEKLQLLEDLTKI